VGTGGAGAALVGAVRGAGGGAGRSRGGGTGRGRRIGALALGGLTVGTGPVAALRVSGADVIGNRVAWIAEGGSEGRYGDGVGWPEGGTADGGQAEELGHR
jgi:hypothetical protein